MGGRYASYWNAFLLQCNVTRLECTYPKDPYVIGEPAHPDIVEKCLARRVSDKRFVVGLHREHQDRRITCVRTNYLRDVIHVLSLINIQIYCQLPVADPGFSRRGITLEVVSADPLLPPVRRKVLFSQTCVILSMCVGGGGGGEPAYVAGGGGCAYVVVGMYAWQGPCVAGGGCA